MNNELTSDAHEAPDTDQFDRAHALRTFQVRMKDGTTRTVFAHTHDNTNAHGHLNFITTYPAGWQRISKSIHADEWRELDEIFEPKTISVALGRMHPEVN